MLPMQATAALTRPDDVLGRLAMLERRVALLAPHMTVLNEHNIREDHVVKSEVARLNQLVEALTQRLDDAEERAAAAESRLSAAESRLSAVEGRLHTAENRLQSHDWDHDAEFIEELP